MVLEKYRGYPYSSENRAKFSSREVDRHAPSSVPPPPPSSPLTPLKKKAWGACVSVSSEGACMQDQGDISGVP